MAFSYAPRIGKVTVAVINEGHVTGGWEAIFKPPVGFLAEC